MPINIGQHHQDSEELQRKRTAKQAMADYEAALADLTTNWSGLDQAAKVAAVRRMVIILAYAVRWLIVNQ